MANLAHQEGNVFYKKGDLESAEKSYALAQKLDATEPKYASNLSAVFFEQGRYTLCIDAIINSWRALRRKHSIHGKPCTPPLSDPLATKLSLRFLKAKLNAFANDLLSLHDKGVKKKTKAAESQSFIEQDILCFSEAAACAQEGGGSPNAELQQNWKLWLKKKGECEGHTPEECRKHRAEAEKRLRDLPIYRSSLYNVLQFFRFGHDDLQALFFGPEGPDIDNESAIYEVTLMEQSWKTIPFLFGGSGDGRQVYATIVQYADMWRNLKKNDFKMPNLHLTIFDIHPAALARVMLIFALIRKSILVDDTAERLEIEATTFYVWSAVHIPAYCAKMIMTVSQELLKELTGNGPKRLTKLWTVDELSKTKVLKIFQFWSKPLAKSTEKFFDRNSPKLPGVNASNPILRSSIAATKDKFQTLASSIRKSSGRLNSSGTDSSLPLYNNFKGEDTLWQSVRTLLPPKEFLSRHPALEKYVKYNGRAGREAMKDEVIRDWKPNPTLFDDHTCENPALTPGGYPEISFEEDPSQTTVDVLSFVYQFRNPLEVVFDQTAFVAIRQLFDCVKECFTMLDDHDGALTLEFVCSELYSGLPKLIAGDLGPRPSSFPTKYLRMWLSNTPDYTGGILSNLVYLAPYLEDTKLAMMIWNCLLNTSSFSTLKDMSINYTYLTSSGIRRFFSCLLRDEDLSSYSEFSLSVLPRTTPFSSVVSKKELRHYLSSILLRVMCCPRSKRVPFQVDEPTNLVSFFRLLVALCRTFACPAHWLGDFVQNMINDNLFTTATLFDGILPVTKVPTPKKQERKLNLEPYQLEIETIITAARGAILFSIVLPATFADSHQSVKTYTARVEPIVDLIKAKDIGPTFTTGSLLFYKPGPSDTASKLVDLPSRIPELIESDDGMVDGIKVQIVSGVEEMDFENNMLAWKMSERWDVRMKEEGWSMIVWVTNRRRTVSAPVPASAWQEINKSAV